jgi:PelA/Pel-15E family pectate lyase
MYIISEDNIITFPSMYSDYIYKKFVMGNDIVYQDLEYLKKYVNITNINLCTKTHLDKFINNGLSYFLDFGFFCKGYCNLLEFNFGQIKIPYNYGSLQDGTGYILVRIMVKRLQIEQNDVILNYLNKIIDYLINMQYANGGIPQYYPLQTGYFRNICMNDGAYLNYIKICKLIIDNMYNVITSTRLDNLKLCLQKSLDLLINLQVIINQTPTIWAQQYDPITLQPTGARSFEPACLASLESAQIIKYLIDINYNNDNNLQTCVTNAINWYKNNKIDNQSQVIMFDKNYSVMGLFVYPRTSLGGLWARMTDINTQQPIYVDRNGIRYDSLNKLDPERKLGYTWLGNWGEYLLNYVDTLT